MMFKAQIEIRNVEEYNLFALFMSNLLAARQELPQQQKVAQPEKQQQIEKAAEQFVAVGDTDDAIVGSIGTPDATITDTKLTDAFQKFALATKKPFPELLAILKKYDATKVQQVPMERRAEFLAEITV